METVNVNGCRFCGHSQRYHYSRYTEGIGYHTFTLPTDTQRKIRMVRNKLNRTLATAENIK